MRTDEDRSQAELGYGDRFFMNLDIKITKLSWL